MILEFENSQGVRRYVGDCDSIEDAFKLIQAFLDEHNYKSYYTRLNYLDNEIEFDVGSHTEFFYLSDRGKDDGHMIGDAQ